MAGIFGTPFLLVLLTVITAGLGGKKKYYDIALDSAIKYAIIHDLFKPLDMQEYRDDIQITNILHVPPYSKYIKKLHTAKKGNNNVELKYMFEAIRDPDRPSLRKRLLCTANINEFFLDGQFYYVLPYRKNLKCEEHSENESDESVDDLSKKDDAIKEPEKKSLKTVTTAKTPVAITTSKTIRTKPKATRITTTSPRPSTKTTTPRTTKKSHATTVSTESTTDIFQPLFGTIFNKESSAPDPMASIVKKTIVSSPSADVAAVNDQPKLKRLGWKPEPSKDLNQGVLQLKLRQATINLDFGGELKQDILGTFLPTNKEHIFENAVINIELGSPGNKKQPIESRFNATSIDSFSTDHRHYSLKDASINLNKAGLGDQIPEILPPQRLSPLQRTLLARLKKKVY